MTHLFSHLSIYIFAWFRKWRLEYEDFLEVLQQLCSDTGLNYDTVKETLVQAGVPSGATEGPVVAK